MLTRCPECQQEVSTQATQCPHCGAPMGAAVAKPVAPPSAQPAFAQPAPPPQPQSHCLRNCLIVGCVLVVLVVGGVFVAGAMLASKIKNSFTQDPQKIASIGASVAPGATTPTGYSEKFGVDMSWFGFKAKGAFLAKGDPNSGGTVIGYGAMQADKNNVNKEKVKEGFQQALQNAGNQNQQGKRQQVEKSEEIELDVAGQPTKAVHMIMVDEDTKKRSSMYVIVLDDWNNEFGWLGVGAVGPEDSFDMDGFKAFLGSLKKK